ncbi:MAG TPA: hypothetical protein VIG73_05625 [Cerasibacillus sp.]|uniref:hypothetical protein n=1 Tax=Cerasibacillus sp. TaxID=2498711 RepID=UPI002F4172F1
MNKENWEMDVKQQLMQQTEDVTRQKTAVWLEIEGRIFRKKRRSIRILTTAITGAVILALLVMSVLYPPKESDQAIDPPRNSEHVPKQDLSEQFAREKTLTIELEGQLEEVAVHLEINEALNHVIYVDEERYIYQSDNQMARIEPKEPLGEDVPEVAMEFFQKDGMTQEEVIAYTKQAMEEERMSYQTTENVLTPFEATQLVAYGEREDWDMPIHRYYLIDRGGGTWLIIKQKYFMIAEEGHAVRFDSMLQTLEFIENSQ